MLSPRRSQISLMAHRIFAMNVSRRLIATCRSETLTRYPFCVSTSQGDEGSNADGANMPISNQVEVCHDTLLWLISFSLEVPSNDAIDGSRRHGSVRSCACRGCGASLMVFGSAVALCFIATGGVQPDGTTDEIRARRSRVSGSGLRFGQARDLRCSP